MKKIIYTILLFTAIFSFSTETHAIRNTPMKYISEKYSIRTCSLKQDIPQTNIRLMNTTPLSYEENEPAYFPISKLTVVDSKQVTVKYEFWIVKMLKKLFD